METISKAEKFISAYKRSLTEMKKVDDNQDEPFYMVNSSSQLKKKEKQSSDQPNQDDCGIDVDGQSGEEVNEISNYDLVVTFLRSKGLDPYKISKPMRDSYKKSPAFQTWKANYLTAGVEVDSTNTISEKSKVELIKQIVKKKVYEDLVDVDKLNKPESSSSVTKGSDYNSKKGNKTDAEYVMIRNKTLTGSKNCDVIEINPKLKTMKSYQYAEKDFGK